MKPPFTLFFSDTHLQASIPRINLGWLRWITEYGPQADAIYILGDFFEVWVGDDERNAFNQQIISTLWQLHHHTPIYLIRGNRDFLIGDNFSQQSGVTLLDDPTVIDCYGQRVLLMHGDSLCTDDKRHQAFRRKTNNRYYRRTFLALPLWLRQKLASRIRRISTQRGQQLAADIMDVNHTTVVNTLKHYQADLLIHGHTHRPGIHPYQVDNKTIERFVLGAWHNNGHCIILSPEQSPRLEVINFDQQS